MSPLSKDATSTMMMEQSALTPTSTEEVHEKEKHKLLNLGKYDNWEELFKEIAELKRLNKPWDVNYTSDGNRWPLLLQAARYACLKQDLRPFTALLSFGADPGNGVLDRRSGTQLTPRQYIKRHACGGAGKQMICELDSGTARACVGGRGDSGIARGGEGRRGYGLSHIPTTYDPTVMRRASDTSHACKNYALMMRCYDGSARPPAWVEGACQRILSRFGGTATLMHTGDVNEALRLATQREPVNMAMDTTLSHKACLKDYFGYSEGYYLAASQRGRVFPEQIAILCETPVSSSGLSPQLLTIAHVINVVGIAFDSPQQPDALYFSRGGYSPLWVADDKIVEFIGKMEVVYGFAFRAAATLGKTLVLAAIGAGAFRPQNWKTESDFVRKVIEVAVEKVKHKFPQVETISAWKNPPLLIPNGLFFPPGVYRPIEDKLFMNAWDPFSMPGNGNKMDRSLDGFWGRSSAISLLCWPRSNPYLKTQSYS